MDLNFKIVVSSKIGRGEGDTIVGILESGKLFIVKIFYPHDQMEEFGFSNVKLEEFVNCFNKFSNLRDGENCSEEFYKILNGDFLTEEQKDKLIYDGFHIMSYKDFWENIEKTSFTAKELMLEILKHNKQ